MYDRNSLLSICTDLYVCHLETCMCLCVFYALVKIEVYRYLYNNNAIINADYLQK